MKQLILLITLMSVTTISTAQNVGIGVDTPSVKLDVAGELRISASENPAPIAGTMRWNEESTDFEGYNGTEWVSLTAGDKEVIDIDNNHYKIVTIGTQVWMAENLRATRYNNGDPIPLVTNNTEWTNLTSPGWCWYENTPSGYGALYNCYAVSDTNSMNVCPVGWHVPTLAEFITLSNELGGELKSGGKLKETGLEHWDPPNDSATNESGFNGGAGGHRDPNTGLFSILGMKGFWQTSTEFSDSRTWATAARFNDGIQGFGNNPKAIGFSVRCLRD
jgi:uncharacterized protein (TIGR02145 family)